MCAQKHEYRYISVSNQSLQCGSSGITLYDGWCCVSSRSSPVPLPHSSSNWMCSVRHLKAQWNGTFIMAVTEIHVICLNDITHFTTVSHNIPAINQTVTLVSHHTPSRHYTRSIVSHDTPAIYHTVTSVRTVLYRWKTVVIYFSFTWYVWNIIHKYISFPWCQ